METCPFYADTLAVSDIHLGWRFSRAKECAALIRRFSGKRLLLLGDILDSRWRRKLGKKLRPFVEAVNDAANRGIKVVLIEGNHDPHRQWLACWFPNVYLCHEYAWVVGNKFFHAWHGHQFNGHNRGIWRLGDLLKELPDELHHFVQRLEGPRHRVSRFIRRLVERLLGLNSSMFKGALKAIRRRRLQVDVAFCGHSHFAEIRELEDVTFVNTGCWVGHDDGMLTYAVVDDLGRVEIRHYAS